MARKKQDKNWQNNVSEDNAKEYVDFVNSNDYVSGYFICLKALRPFPGLSALQKEIVASIMGDIPCKHGKKEKGGFWDERCPKFLSKMIGESFDTIKKNLPYLVQNKFLYRVKPYATKKDIPYLYFVHPGFLSLLLSLTNKASKRALPESFKQAFNAGTYYPEGTPINKLKEEGDAFFGKISSAINTQLENQQGIKDPASSAINTQLTNSSSAINTHKERNIYKENINTPSRCVDFSNFESEEEIATIPYLGILKFWNKQTYKMKMREDEHSMRIVNKLMKQILEKGITEHQVKTSIKVKHDNMNDETIIHPSLDKYLEDIRDKKGQAYRYLFIEDSSIKREEEPKSPFIHEKAIENYEKYLKKFVTSEEIKSEAIQCANDGYTYFEVIQKRLDEMRTEVKRLADLGDKQGLNYYLAEIKNERGKLLYEQKAIEKRIEDFNKKYMPKNEMSA